MTYLKITAGQRSDKGRKKVNQDFHGVYTPDEPLLSSKGIAIALADGISSSDVSGEASQTAVTSFLEDYYCTSESWSVKNAVQRVLMATNSWLHAQTRRSRYRFENKDRGYVCTFSALVFKSTTAHIFHVGDARIYRLTGGSLEQLTEDHRTWISQNDSYLSRALGIDNSLDIDYQAQPLETGDIFVLATDGIYEHAAETFITATIQTHIGDLDRAAQIILDESLERGSTDNLTIQIVRIEELPNQGVDEVYQQLTTLPFPPLLEARMPFDGYRIVREVHSSSRSHVYLATDTDTNEQVVIKTPSVDLRSDPAYLERFLMEEWVARRIDNAHVLKPCQQKRKRNYLYIVTEYIEGQTLAQWMIDNPKPNVEVVRGIIEQIAKGLQAFHRQEMLHQDIRPNNIIIDHNGTVKIIDFGSTRVAGLTDISKPITQQQVLGTAQYTAPEYFLGESGTTRSDLFSLGVLAYYMLSGKLPYGARVSNATSKAAQRKLKYASVLSDDSNTPAWLDQTLRKAVQLDPYKRYAELSEFVYDLRHPSKAFLNKTRAPLMERNPVLGWQLISLLLFIVNLWQLSKLW